MNENSDILSEAYEELFALGMVQNHCRFSEDWLLKSRRYYSMIRASGRKPSVSAIGSLAARLKQQHEMMRTSQYGELRYRAESIYPLVRKVWTALYEASLET